MRVEDLRHYGSAFSDAESSWPADLKKRMTKTSKKIVMSKLGFWEGFQLLFRYMKEKRRMLGVDLSEIRARGMNNEPFIRTQLEIAALFSALSQTVGKDRALETMYEVMDATAPEALALCMPSIEDMKTFDDPLQACKDYFAPSPEAAEKAGCQLIEVVEDTEDTFRFDMTYCVWYELAKTFGVPDACLPNCHSDDIFFPGYYESFGLEYSRENTIARGGATCDFKLTRK